MVALQLSALEERDPDARYPLPPRSNIVARGRRTIALGCHPRREQP
jgi:hypothetical protein